MIMLFSLPWQKIYAYIGDQAVSIWLGEYYRMRDRYDRWILWSLWKLGLRKKMPFCEFVKRDIFDMVDGKDDSTNEK